MITNKTERKQKLKESKGITLIALVITIIVLLILAGVTIATLTGENGILNQANKSKISIEEARIEEEIKLALIKVNASKQINDNQDKDKATLLKEELQKNDTDVEVSTNEINGKGLITKYKGQYYWIDDNNNIEKEQDLHGVNLLEVGNWKLTNGVDFWAKRDLESAGAFWEKVDEHVRTGYDTHRYVIRYSNNTLIDWSKYETITVTFKQIQPETATMVLTGIGFGNGEKIEGYKGPSLKRVSANAGILSTTTIKLKEQTNLPTIPTFIYWQNAVWYPGQTCEVELYEIRLD